MAVPLYFHRKDWFLLSFHLLVAHKSGNTGSMLNHAEMSGSDPTIISDISCQEISFPGQKSQFWVSWYLCCKIWRKSCNSEREGITVYYCSVFCFFPFKLCDHQKQIFSAETHTVGY